MSVHNNDRLIPRDIARPFVFGCILLLLVACSALPNTTQTQTEDGQPTITSSPSVTASATATYTVTRKPSATASKTAAYTATSKPSPMASKTSAPSPTATSIPSITPTFDVASIVTRTSEPPAVCPAVNPELVPDFSSAFSAVYPRLEEPILDFLDSGGSPQAVIKYLQANDRVENRSRYYENDLTGDGVPELIISRIGFYVFGCGDGYYYTLTRVENDDWVNLNPPPWIIETKDMNLDGLPEIVVQSYIFSWTIFRIFEWDPENPGWDGGYFQSLLKVENPIHGFNQDVAALESAEVQLHDIDGNGTVELILEGGIPNVLSLGSLYANGYPWRKETDTYMWNGEAFVLSSVAFTPPEYRFQAVQDGDRATLASEYDAALAFYQEAIFSDKLEWWSLERKENILAYEQSRWSVGSMPFPTLPAPDLLEYPNLAAYARFRILLLHMTLGYLPEALTVYNTLQEKFPAGQPGHAYAEMAAAFWNEYQASHDIGKACSKAIEYAAANPVEILGYLGNNDYTDPTYPYVFGDQSLTYQPKDICPFP